MKVKELVEKLNLKVLSGEKGLDREIDGCYISDLLSDVMGNAMEGNIWITLQTHKNVMAVASLKEMSCIILVKNLMPNDETIEQSNDEDLPILQTNLPTYEIAGLVYNLLHQTQPIRQSFPLPSWRRNRLSAKAERHLPSTKDYLHV